MTFIHPYDDEAVIAGQGTIGLEIVEDLPEVDSVIVPVGGGGLIAGMTVIGIKFFSTDLAAMGARVDFEGILPAVVLHHLPVGARGLILAALLAAS